MKHDKEVQVPAVCEAICANSGLCSWAMQMNEIVASLSSSLEGKQAFVFKFTEVTEQFCARRKPIDNQVADKRCIDGQPGLTCADCAEVTTCEMTKKLVETTLLSFKEEIMRELEVKINEALNTFYVSNS